MKSVYFFIAPHESYNDLAIHLAEGLVELGVPIFSNRDFWQLEPDKPDYLFRHDSTIQPQDCTIVVITTLWFHYMEPGSFEIKSLDLPSGLLDNGRKHKIVLLDAEDGYKTTSFQPVFRKFDMVFRTKMNGRTFNHANMTPWVLGFGKRIMRATSNAPAFSNRKRCIVQNFGFTHKFMHGVRVLGIERFLNRLDGRFAIDSRITNPDVVPDQPWDLLMWKQTVGKHNPSYYSQIGEAQCVACFCGDFVPGFPHDPSKILVGGGKARLLRKIFTLRSIINQLRPRIIQWDSWRFWETLANGSVAIHIDLQLYGVSLPIMPENWVHYVGLDLENIDQDLRRFLKLGERHLAEIAFNGQKWAYENYGPLAIAKRFMSVG